MSKNPLKLWALFASVYITQYIGVAFILASTVAIMREMGMALDKIAMINIIALPLLLKIFYAPFIDNIQVGIFKWKIKGAYRSWLLTAQCLMVLLLVVIGQLDLLSNFSLALGLMLLYGFAVSVQDVAIDGLACKVFDDKQRHYANSIQFSGNLLGNIIGGGLILMAYDWLGWQGCLLLLAGLTSLSWGQLLFFNENDNITTPSNSLRAETAKHCFARSQDKSYARVEGGGLLIDNLCLSNDLNSNAPPSLLSAFKQLWTNIKAFIKRHKVWFGLLLLYPLSLSASFSLINPLLVDADWQLADIGFATKVFGSLVGVFSALSASVLIAKFGKNNSLVYLTFAQALALLALLPLGFGYTDKAVVYSVIAIYFLLTPALMTTIATHIMHKASQESAKATFFTLQLGLLSFIGFAYAGIAMAVAKYVGYGAVMVAVSAIALLICGLVYKLARRWN